MTDDIDTILGDLQSNFLAAFTKFEATFGRLLASSSLSPGEKRDLGRLAKIREMGLKSRYSKLKIQSSQDELLSLVQAFCAFGPSAVLKVGSQRGGDFLLNQLRGQWAELVCCSIEWPDHTILPFGPSGSAMPGEDDHESIVRTFREITLTEGKRPDLIVFGSEYWAQLSEPVKEAASKWPNRLLSPTEHAMVELSTCAIEVKHSTWHYSKRREAGGGPLAVTIKQEEIESISEWSARYGINVLFMQVLFDEVYCMSFLRMCDAIAKKQMYESGDYEAAKDRKTSKHTHRFFLNGETHLIARTVFPDQSKAFVTVLPHGYVIPHIKFDPIGTTDSRPDVVEKELAYRSDSC
jgi:hypothetical protein